MQVFFGGIQLSPHFCWNPDCPLLLGLLFQFSHLLQQYLDCHLPLPRGVRQSRHADGRARRPGLLCDVWRLLAVLLFRFPCSLLPSLSCCSGLVPDGRLCEGGGPTKLLLGYSQFLRWTIVRHNDVELYWGWVRVLRVWGGLPMLPILGSGADWLSSQVQWVDFRVFHCLQCPLPPVGRPYAHFDMLYLPDVVLHKEEAAFVRIKWLSF